MWVVNTNNKRCDRCYVKLMYYWILGSLAQTTSEGFIPLTERSSTFCSPHENAAVADLLIMVHSEPENVDDRNKMRGIMRLGESEATRNARVVFFVEKPLTAQDFYQNVLLENGVYNDIVWTNLSQQVDDHQSNENGQWFYRWATSTCETAKFVLTVQDSVIINLWEIMSFIDGNRNASRTMWSYSDDDSAR